MGSSIRLWLSALFLAGQAASAQTVIEDDRSLASDDPAGCRAPSQDTLSTNYYRIDATAGWDAGEWKWHAGAGIARTHLSVQVDALVLVGTTVRASCRTSTLPGSRSACGAISVHG